MVIRRFAPRTWLIALAWLIPAILSGPSVGATECLGLVRPVPGPIAVGFAPVGLYAGHWGADLSAPSGEVVRSAGSGRVELLGNGGR